MTAYSRTTKSNGTTSWLDGETIEADEHNDEWTTFLNDYNGKITNSNVKADADISASKIGDYATNDATFLTTASPGTYFSTSKPTDLTGELTRLRYRINANTLATNLKALNSSGSMVSIGWLEPPCVGNNLLPNSGFEVQTGAAGTAPDGWTLSGSPTTCVIEDAIDDVAGTEKRSINLIGDGTGITVTVTGLKADTKYRVGMQYIVTDETVSLTTSGGLGGSANYGDLAITDDTASTLTVQNGVIQTDSSGTDIVVSILTSGSASAEVNVFNVWMYEMREDAPLELPKMPVSRKTVTTAVDYGPSSGTTLTYYEITGLANTLYCPAHGYRLVIDAAIPFICLVLRTYQPHAYFQIKVNGSIVYGPVLFSAGLTITPEPYIQTAVLHHVVDDLTPGTSYAVTFEVGDYDGSNPQIAPEAEASEQLEASSTLRMERI